VTADGRGVRIASCTVLFRVDRILRADRGSGDQETLRHACAVPMSSTTSIAIVTDWPGFQRGEFLASALYPRSSLYGETAVGSVRVPSCAHGCPCQPVESAVATTWPRCGRPVVHPPPSYRRWRPLPRYAARGCGSLASAARSRRRAARHGGASVRASGSGAACVTFRGGRQRLLGSAYARFTVHACSASAQ